MLLDSIHDMAHETMHAEAGAVQGRYEDQFDVAAILATMQSIHDEGLQRSNMTAQQTITPEETVTDEQYLT